MDESFAEEMIKKYGEQYRLLITSGLKFLDVREPVWHLDKPIDRERYIKDLIKRSK